MKNNLTLLYVEDDALVRENFTEIFKAYFANIISTDSGDEALEIYENRQIDVAILDVNINGLDGISVAKKLRASKREGELLILIISAYSEREKLLRVINLNLFGYLIKPVKNSELFKVLDEMVYTLGSKNFTILSDKFRWNNTEKILYHQQERVKLTKNESLALEALILHKNSYMSACDLHVEIFSIDEPQHNNCNNIVQLLSRLKKKLYALNPDSEHFIENRYGTGYKISIN